MSEIRKLFVSAELAKKAKDKGFDEDCLGLYNVVGLETACDRYHPLPGGYRNSEIERDACLAAPTYQQLVDWFREKHSIEIYCLNYYRTDKQYGIQYECRVNGRQLSFDTGSSSSVLLFNTYYEALDAAITGAFNLIK